MNRSLNAKLFNSSHELGQSILELGRQMAVSSGQDPDEIILKEGAPREVRAFQLYADQAAVLLIGMRDMPYPGDESDHSGLDAWFATIGRWAAQQAGVDPDLEVDVGEGALPQKAFHVYAEQASFVAGSLKFLPRAQEKILLEFMVNGN